mgnify:FL=1
MSPIVRYTFVLSKKTQDMATIDSTDIIFATVTQRGKDVVSLRMSGMTSFSEIVKRMQTAVTSPLGLVTLRLRNYTQGWSQHHALVLR